MGVIYEHWENLPMGSFPWQPIRLLHSLFYLQPPEKKTCTDWLQVVIYESHCTQLLQILVRQLQVKHYNIVLGMAIIDLKIKICLWDTSYRITLILIFWRTKQVEISKYA
ncbi:hypothetical protein XELAEV_18012319mg [Xenopus laevis]|uniref:Uncharacterized protein n=1 Tax=Xenopus laevis TaxID=8355 RepID=A0A974HY10_XENLA|nr:hypothetical protein XELAEV_18012319mg [Xenopus laevis]